MSEYRLFRTPTLPETFSLLTMSSHLIIKWPGFESNPDVLTSFAAKLGLDVNQWAFKDVWVRSSRPTFPPRPSPIDGCSSKY